MEIITERWFISFDIVMIICNILVIIFSIVFLLTIIIDKKCHTISMMLIGNSCASAFVFGCVLFSMNIFTLQNDLKQIEYEDRFCVFRGYANYVSVALFYYSFLIQSIYRYLLVINPIRLICQSVKLQFLFICLIWIFCVIYPLVFIFTGQIIYNIDNQLCQLPLLFSVYNIYTALCIYIIPVSVIMLIYFKLVRYVRGMSQHVTPANTLFHAQRELKIVQHIVILITILLTLGLPFTFFALISFFRTPPKYHFRISFIFIDVSLVLVLMALFYFTDSLKESIMKKIKCQQNTVMPTI